MTEEHSYGTYIVKVVLCAVIPVPLLPLLDTGFSFDLSIMHKRFSKNLCVIKLGKKICLSLLSTRVAGDEQLR